MPVRATRRIPLSCWTLSKNCSRSRGTTQRYPSALSRQACASAWWALRPGRKPSRRSDKSGAKRGTKPGKSAGALTRSRAGGIPRRLVPPARLRQIYCPNRRWTRGLAQELLSHRGPGVPQGCRQRLDAPAVDSRGPCVGLDPSEGGTQGLSTEHRRHHLRGLWHERRPFRRGRVAPTTRLMAASGRRLPGLLALLNSPAGASCGSRGRGIGPGAPVRASDRSADPARPLLTAAHPSGDLSVS